MAPLAPTKAWTKVVKRTAVSLALGAGSRTRLQGGGAVARSRMRDGNVSVMGAARSGWTARARKAETTVKGRMMIDVDERMGEVLMMNWTEMETT